MMNVKSKKEMNQQVGGEDVTPKGATWCQEKGNTKPSPKRIAPAKQWCFTFNNYTENDVSSLLAHKRFQGAKKYMFQEEIGESGTPHLQGFIVFQTKIRPLSLKLSKKIHWEKMKGNVFENIKYCSKNNTVYGKCYYKGCKPFKEIVSIEQSEFYDWQISLLNIIQNCDDDRIIHWVYEKTGGVGKSTFCKWLAIHEQAVICGGKAADMKYMLTQRLIRGDSTDLIIFDIPRSKLNRISYDGMEEIKNGLFCCTKYETCMTIMNSPTVIIFANDEPKYKAISLDRWEVYEIVDNKLIHEDMSSQDVPLLNCPNISNTGNPPPINGWSTPPSQILESPIEINTRIPDATLEYKVTPELLDAIQHGGSPRPSMKHVVKSKFKCYFN